jgi:transcriptional regulator with XRE-family HTH domain
MKTTNQPALFDLARDEFRGVFAEKLRELIEDSGTSVTETAEMVGLSRSQLTKLLSGERLPSGAAIWALSRYFDVSPAYFFPTGLEEIEKDLDFLIQASQR